MTYQHIEDLPVWQEAARLYNRVLDVMAQHRMLFSPGYRDQIDRAALSVSNNIAEGFERVTTAELLQFLDYAKGSAGEVKSMVMIVVARPEMAPATPLLRQIRSHADACVKQLQGWIASIDRGLVQGKRHLTGPQKIARKQDNFAKRFRTMFLQGLKPDHPLYGTPEAEAARQEPLISREEFVKSRSSDEPIANSQ
jgi:four helix bundle protein